jgi:hypothetical protein
MAKEVTSNGFLTDAELEQSYPHMVKLFGKGSFSVDRLSGIGMSSAHMTFEPDIERALKKAAQEKVWEAFEFEITVKRKPKRKAAAERAQVKPQG